MDTRNKDSPVVYICSRYSGDVERNTELARQYSRLAVERGCVPLTPHLLLPQFLSEETERDKAISLDLRFLGLCQELWVCGPEVSEGMRREIKEETGLDVKNIEYLFSSPNVYMYSGMGVHTLDMDFLVRVHGNAVAVKAADDAAEALWIPINKVNPAEFGLTSIRNAVIRFLTETLRK